MNVHRWSGGRHWKESLTLNQFRDCLLKKAGMLPQSRMNRTAVQLCTGIVVLLPWAHTACVGLWPCLSSETLQEWAQCLWLPEGAAPSGLLDMIFPLLLLSVGSVSTVFIGVRRCVWATLANTHTTGRGGRPGPVVVCDPLEF